jgi:hypothetical protein
MKVGLSVQLLPMADANSQPSVDEDQNNEHGIENAENGRNDSDTSKF